MLISVKWNKFWKIFTLTADADLPRPSAGPLLSVPPCPVLRGSLLLRGGLSSRDTRGPSAPLRLHSGHWREGARGCDGHTRLRLGRLAVRRGPLRSATFWRGLVPPLKGSPAQQRSAKVEDYTLSEPTKRNYDEIRAGPTTVHRRAQTCAGTNQRWRTQNCVRRKKVQINPVGTDVSRSNYV